MPKVYCHTVKCNQETNTFHLRIQCALPPNLINKGSKPMYLKINKWEFAHGLGLFCLCSGYTTQSNASQKHFIQFNTAEWLFPRSIGKNYICSGSAEPLIHGKCFHFHKTYSEKASSFSIFHRCCVGMCKEPSLNCLASRWTHFHGKQHLQCSPMQKPLRGSL